MKAKFLPLLLLAILLQVSMFSFANEMTSARRIRLKNKTEVQHRSIPVTPDACIENSLLSIDLLSTVPTVTVIIKNAETDEVVYTSTDLNVDKVYIDLTGEEKGKYTLEIQLPKFGFVHFADAPSLAALACEAAGEQKQFWTFHDTIFNYSGVADSAFIYNLAKSKRLNMTEFDAYLHSSDKYKEMDKVINQLVERGLMATPTIIINDRLVYVTNSYEELSRLLEYEL